MLDYFINGFRDGMVVNGRPEYDITVVPEHIGSPWFIVDILKILLKRICMYWSIYFDGYSSMHKLFVLGTILPTFILSIWSIIQVIRNKAKSFYPLITMTMFYFVLQVFTEVDFDQRYRAPIFMILIILCSYGVSDIYKKIRVNERN